MMNEELEMTALNEEELETITGGRTVLHGKHGDVDIFSGPGKNYSLIATADKYDDLVCVGEAKKDKRGKTWIKIRAFGVTGWVRGDKVS